MLRPVSHRGGDGAERRTADALPLQRVCRRRRRLPPADLAPEHPAAPARPRPTHALDPAGDRRPVGWWALRQPRGRRIQGPPQPRRPPRAQHVYQGRRALALRRPELIGDLAHPGRIMPAVGPTDRNGRRYSAPMVDFTALPDDLPVPVDDGAADHLPGTALPPITLLSTTGDRVDFKKLGPG